MTLTGGDHRTKKGSPPSLQIGVARGHFVYSDHHRSYHHSPVSAHALVPSPPHPSVRLIHRDTAAAHRRGSRLVPTPLIETSDTPSYHTL